MKKDVNATPFGKNPFEDIFAEFDEKNFFERLHNQIKNKSYYEKYRGFKNTLLLLSYLFNIASALTASYAVYWLTHKITGVPIAGYILAFLFLIFLEKIKRKSSSEFFQVLFFRKKFTLGWFSLSLFCLAISLSSSGFGVKQGTEQLAPAPELVKADSMLTHYYKVITALEKKSADLRANKDQSGTTFYKLSDAITANEKAIADYRIEAKRLEQKLEGENEKLTSSYTAEIKHTAKLLLYINLFMELLFECCIAYVWYFYYRSYVERNSALQSLSKSESSVDTQQINQLQATIKSLKIENESLRTDVIPPPSNNGTEIYNRTPIGFSRGHTRTQNNMKEFLLPNDTYTIPHTYTRGGERITVHYNSTMVKSRIKAYQKKIQEAQSRNMATHILKNREKWLSYWIKQQEKLLEKRKKLFKVKNQK